MSWIQQKIKMVASWSRVPRLQERVSVGIALTVLTMYLLPLLTYGTSLHILVYDNLDGIIPTVKILAQSGQLFADSTSVLPQMMGGLPRLSFGSEWRLVVWLYALFPPFTAYAVHEMLIHVVAFASMAYFLKSNILSPTFPYRYVMRYGIALAFALMPFWPMGSLSIPLMPLAAAILLKIRAGHASRLEWGLLMLVPLASSFVVYYFFFLLIAGAVWLRDLLVKRQWNLAFFFAIAGMVSVFLLVDYRLVYEMFFDAGYVSNRVEFIKTYIPFAQAYKIAHLTFLEGQPHSRSIHLPFILSMVIVGIMLTRVRTQLSLPLSLALILLLAGTFMTTFWNQALGNFYTMPVLLVGTTVLLVAQTHSRPFLGLFLLQIVIAYWYAFWYYEGWESIAEQFRFIEMFHFSRFNNLQPFVWYVLMAYSVSILVRKVRFATPFLVVLIAFQVVMAFNHRTFQIAVSRQAVTYDNFYAVDMFKKIKEYIGLPQSQYRVVSLGIYPAVSLYNGFYTLDGYMNNYPLSYAHLFEKFTLRPDAFRYRKAHGLQNWTSKCYIPVEGKVYYDYTKNESADRLHMDTSLMYKHGLRFVLSGYRLSDPEQFGLEFLEYFSDQRSYWDVYLYAVRKEKI